MPIIVQALALVDARRIIAAGEAIAEKIGVPSNIVAVDADRNLIAHPRAPGPQGKSGSS